MENRSRAVIESFYQHPGLTLLATLTFGITVGLLLAAWILHLALICERYARNRSRKAAIHAETQNPREEIPVDDERMICRVCWEARHPGQRWAWRWQTLCQKHLKDTHASSSRERLHSLRKFGMGRSSPVLPLWGGK
jgi:hypothetical protein